MTSRRLIIISLSLILAGSLILLGLLLVSLRRAPATANVSIASGTVAPTAHPSPTPTKAPAPPIYVGVWQTHVTAYDAHTGKALWQATVQNSAPYGLPVINNGIVFLGTDSTIYAWRLSDGKALWFAHIGTLSQLTPVLGASNIYFMTGANAMLAVRQSDGAVQWHVDGGQQSGDGYGAYATPMLVNGILFFGASTLYAVRASDGTVLWKYHDSAPNPVYHGESFAIKGTIYLDTNRVYFNGINRELYALKLADGTLAWKFAANSILGVLDGSVIPIIYGMGYQNYFNNIGALDAATGKVLWTQTPGTSELGFTAFANNGTFYYANGTEITAVASATGTAIWDDPNAHCTIYNPVLTTTTAYMAGPVACAVELASGKLLWRVASTANPGNGLTVVNYQLIGTTLIAEEYGQDDSGLTSAIVVALHVADGTTAWNVNLL
jgi:outer membrane protein assembly factor BamB